MNKFRITWKDGFPPCYTESEEEAHALISKAGISGTIEEIKASRSNLLLGYYPSIDYAVIARVRGDEVQDYVAAWGYRAESDSWAQGHYFSDLLDCVAYINKKLSEV